MSGAFAIGLFVLVALELILRRPEKTVPIVEGSEPPETNRSSFLLRALLPNYHFFPSIERRLSLRARTVNAETIGPWIDVLPAPRRRGFFLFHNPEENLWLFKMGELDRYVEEASQATPSPADLSLIAGFAAAFRNEQSNAAQQLQLAIFSGENEHLLSIPLPDDGLEQPRSR